MSISNELYRRLIKLPHRMPPHLITLFVTHILGSWYPHRNLVPLEVADWHYQVCTKGHGEYSEETEDAIEGGGAPGSDPLLQEQTENPGEVPEQVHLTIECSGCGHLHHCYEETPPITTTVRRPGKVLRHARKLSPEKPFVIGPVYHTIVLPSRKNKR